MHSFPSHMHFENPSTLLPSTVADGVHGQQVRGALGHSLFMAWIREKESMHCDVVHHEWYMVKRQRDRQADRGWDEML